MKLGLGHQRPEILTPDYVRYLRQAGVEAVAGRLTLPDASHARPNEIKRLVDGAGIELHEVMLADTYNCTRIAAGRLRPRVSRG